MTTRPATTSPVRDLLLRLLPAVGAFAAILVTGLVTTALVGGTGASLLVASMGASAVIMFCLPDSPLGRPWPFVGGHFFSVLVGILAAQSVSNTALASALAVGGAIVAMTLFRCIHPPGGAAALTAVVGGPAVTNMGYGFLLTPVAVNVALMLALVYLIRAAERLLAAPPEQLAEEALSRELMAEELRVESALTEEPSGDDSLSRNTPPG